MIDTSVARSAPPSTHPKSPSLCAGCGEPAGSISKGTGFPLVRNRHADGLMYHVRCLPGTRDLDAVWSSLERMGG